MKKNYIIALLIIFSAALNINAQFAKLSKDVFGTRVLIENKGQFDKKVNSLSPVKYGYETSGERIYFTDKGPIYKLIKRFIYSHEQMEKLEHGKYVPLKADEVYQVNVNWIGCNDNIQIIESEKQSHYFTYGSADLNSSTFKKITYKNVYNNIDIEYTLPEDKESGIKYNVILHPGANPADVRISYTGDVQKIVKSGNNIIIKTPLEDITETAPISYYQNKGKIASKFNLNQNVISFEFPEGYNSNETVVIDPWVFTMPTLTGNNVVYDIDYDGLGNTFVYGGMNFIKVAKYDPLGTLIWTFAGSVPGITWDSQGPGNFYTGNFIVHKLNGKTYLGQGFDFTGTRTIRLDAAGNYDNFVTVVVPEFRELWDMGFHCGTGNVYGLGGTTANGISAALINQNNGVQTTANFTGLGTWGQDVVSNAIDDLGNIFVIFASNGTPSANNALLRVNPGFNGNIWFQPSTYATFNEANNKNGYLGYGLASNGFNCLAVSGNYLYYYNGFDLAAYNKATGVKIGFTTIPGHIVKRFGGIAVDDCDNVYIGGDNNVLSYNFNGSTFSALPSIPLNAPSVQKHVYDIKLDKANKLLYVGGSGFAGTFSAVNSLTCGTANAFSLTLNCNGFNSGTAVASLTTAIANPSINYIWTNQAGTVAVTMGTTSTSNSVNLPNGTYTLNIQINAPCGPAYVNTINVNCCNAVNVTHTIVQAGCTNTVNSATVTATGGGTVVPIITWNPAPLTLSGNSLTATGLPIGTTTVVLDYGGGCTNTIGITALPAPPPITFTINNLTGTYTITCTNPVIDLQAVSNYTYGPLSYSWTSISFTAGTSSVSINAPNTITLTVTDPSTGCLLQQVVTIGINTVAPTNSVNPVSQAITCNSGAPVTFSGTVSNPTVNVQHDWYSPLNPLPGGVPIATSNNTISILSGALPPGVYTLVTTNLVNGCTSQKTVTITSLSAWPTFSLSSPTNFSVGCNPLHQTTISIINPVSTQTPPATCSYTFLAPSFTGVVTPSVILGNNSSTTTTIPGTWTIIVQDNSNFCRSIISVPIIQNTVAPHVAASMATNTLLCRTPTVLATGTSTTPNTIVTWNVPSTPPTLSTPTVVIGDPANGPNTSSTSLTYANFTVVATNTLNACQSTSVITIYQNFKPPISNPTISIATPTAIYCTVANAPVVLTTGNSTTTSGGGPSAFVANPCWQGPSPQTPTCGPSSYSCYVPGVYTLTIEDNYNGCTDEGTVTVLDRSQPPVITNTLSNAILDCGGSQASLSVAITGTNTGGLRYLLIEYPIGASYSPSNAASYNVNPSLSGTSSSTINVSLPGWYQVIVSNTLTGCRALAFFEVTTGGLTASFTPEPQSGYAPLNVNFTNQSASSSGSSSITSVWSFGNGTSQTTTLTNTSAVYNAPGSYTVMLYTTKGSCVDSAYRVIKVEMPSKLEVPNIFTPNGDGSNDVFFLKVANIEEVSAIIHDRWGNKVYETLSKTGNIAWDGKNFGGKECSAGVYFYIIKGKGFDGKEYEQKGNVTLMR
ncbi:MAG: gliding motility-associated C-terminal domain-containing protein [Sphingobacteriaceae bacterium]|nr:gliding motility-associated C-terminal domain-containing protein [Sphingobacteriaceae bacterium]